MHRDDLVTLYRRYLDCLNARDWAQLDRFVHADVVHNGKPLGLVGYRAMLERDVDQIPDLGFAIGHLVCEPPSLAARLQFDCTPRATFMGVAVDGRRVRFVEHVFYAFADGLIREVWSVIDKAAIEAQLAGPR